MITTIADIGSTHMGKLEYALEGIDLAKEAGFTICKFQLFKGNENGNIELPRKYWKKLVKHARDIGIDIFASVFDNEAVDLLWDSGIKKVKLAYSQAFNLKLLKHIKKYDFEIWASGNCASCPEYADVSFLCIPEYPVKQAVGTDETTYSRKLFKGFSSHYLGYKTDIRVLSTVKEFEYLEKHITLDHDDIECPDHYFALTPKEAKELCKAIKSL